VEVTDGTHWRLTVDEPAVPLADYVRRQGRFRHLDDDALARLQSDVDARWSGIRTMIER
jgi:pyruvate/2-oxoacid:ferredoxin oxidoreductase beta subunit